MHKTCKKIFSLLNFRYVSKKQQVHKKFPWTSLGISIAILLISIIAFHKVGNDNQAIKSLFDNLPKFFNFKDYHSITGDVYTTSDTFQKSIEFIFKTIGIALVGTVIGAFVALPLAFLASKNTIKSKFIYIPMRIILSIMRAFPPILLAYILKYEFVSDTNGVITISIFVASIMAKWMYEEFDSVDTESQIMLEAFGANKWMAFKRGMFPQVTSKFVSLTLYAFEMTVRFASILGVIGLTGIGVLISRYQSIPGTWGQLTIVISVIVMFVMLIEALAWGIRKFVLNNKAKDYSKEFKEKGLGNDEKSVQWVLKNPRKLWIPKVVFALTSIGIVIYFVLNLRFDVLRNTDEFPVLLKALAKPDWKFITDWSLDNNALKLALESLGMVICSIIIGLILAIPIGLIASKNVVPAYIAFIFRFILILIRSVPAYVYAIVLWMGGTNPNFVGALALGVHAIGMMGKLIAETADNVDEETIAAGNAFGMGTFAKIKYIIWNSVRPQILSTAIYRVEINFKQTVMLGALGISAFGYEMLNATAKLSTYGKASAFIIVTLGVVLILEQISNMTRLKINRGYIFRKPKNKFKEDYYSTINLDTKK
ncbi:MAG: ABC transporter permease subunit [Mycoplasmatales bacterium]|nr:ABC transporter permease subunit [Mycoplasmatales bacterium]